MAKAVGTCIVDRLEQARVGLVDAQRALQRGLNALRIASGLARAPPPGTSAEAVLERIARLREEIEAAGLDEALGRFESDAQELCRAARVTR